LSGAAKYPAGARPSKCYLFIYVQFEIIRKGTITFRFERFFNLVSWQEIHEHYSQIDRRIPPFACCVQEGNRPYYSNTLLEFKLIDGIEIPDALTDEDAVAGETNAHGQVLPPVIFAQQPIDMTGDTKVQEH
jgi:hypothetical protein